MKQVQRLVQTNYLFENYIYINNSFNSETSSGENIRSLKIGAGLKGKINLYN